ncbi:YgaP family membrane protein [Alicyclobacillus macrosporangiidus]|uniref:YgaP family membrane protein n=1 Tax=Alicyclobacillus macrosporangiidus TaxID=392015 RepID=UPI00068E4EFF|nr:DUF2892 domain-containing protein [Alicyclobacillus macrosporangiidus]MCL6600220.1 DUF2892 domain-containing protein [Alicyclobacillus macrosporangiidus]
MHIKPNLGVVDRYIRLAGGLVLLASASGQRKLSLSRYALAGLGAMKVAEGITGWCPLVQLAQATAELVQDDLEARPQQHEHRAGGKDAPHGVHRPSDREAPKAHRDRPRHELADEADHTERERRHGLERAHEKNRGIDRDEARALEEIAKEGINEAYQ